MDRIPLQNANLIDGSSAPARQGAVLMEGERITAVGEVEQPGGMPRRRLPGPRGAARVTRHSYSAVRRSPPAIGSSKKNMLYGSTAFIKPA
jgi:hypothetical protein